MRLAGNTVLVTGGGSGIGLALAKRFSRAGSAVIVCGRRREALDEACAAMPGARARVCDLAQETERVALAAWLAREAPELNVLVNNAGIQRRVSLAPARTTATAEPWEGTREEIAINLEAPIRLTALLGPQLARQPHAAIVNVTSGLSFVPLARVPVYCATKAALHSFTMSLRHQSKGGTIEIVEVIPPAVNTDLGGPGLHTFGAPLEEFADAVAAKLDAGETEIAYGFSEQAGQIGRAEIAERFERMNG